MKRPLKAYLKRGRLADVLALLQVLALDKSAHRSEAGLVEELQGTPTSASEWREVAREHPEFFRVRRVGENIVSLTARHVLGKENEKWPQLPTEFTYKLIQTAMDLHDRELTRRDQWKNFIPVAAAIIAGFFAVAVAVLKIDNPQQQKNSATATASPSSIESKK